MNHFLRNGFFMIPLFTIAMILILPSLCLHVGKCIFEYRHFLKKKTCQMNIEMITQVPTKRQGAASDLFMEAESERNMILPPSPYLKQPADLVKGRGRVGNDADPNSIHVLHDVHTVACYIYSPVLPGYSLRTKKLSLHRC